MWPPNPQRVAPDALAPSTTEGGSVYLLAASSDHPGGANFAFADGSVRFVKDAIDSWPLDPTTQVVEGEFHKDGLGRRPARLKITIDPSGPSPEFWMSATTAQSARVRTSAAAEPNLVIPIQVRKPERSSR